jgi:integrase
VDILREQIGKNETFVFTYRGRGFKQINRDIWKKALAAAGIDDFRWHDFRHTWASHMIQNGVPSEVLQTLGAWKTERMVKRYAHQSAGSLRPFAERVGEVFGNVTFTSQPANDDLPALKLLASN